MDNIKAIVENQKAFFQSGVTKDISFRINALKKLREAIKSNEENILKALNEDLGKSYFEGYETEVGIVLEEITYTLKHIKNWAKPQRVKTPITQFLSHSYIYNEPYGIVLIMAPWNYPFQLSIAPLIGSIAAGNCTLIKPSDYSPNTSKVIAKIIKENFEDGFISVVQGGRKENTSLLEQQFDYIFFTGSTSVGKIVMEAASKHLTPISLELGGKSPCIIDKTADIDLAAKRIVWGKFLNGGQTCVAPDYMLVHKEVKDNFINCAKKYINQFYGNNPIESDNLCHIINEKHFERLMNLMKEGTIVEGGNGNKAALKIAPTIINEVKFEYPVMQEEIFGPIMPIIEYENLDNIIATITSLPKPLALYLFTTDKTVEEKILSKVSFGGGCVNDTIVHLATSYMPFGGVGMSGMGGYHGKWSFETFSHKKSILKKSNLIDINIRYAPYNDKINILKKLMK